MGSWDGTLPAALPSGFVPQGSDWEAIRDAVAGLTDPWTTYVPAWTAVTTNPVVGNGNITGASFRAGKTGVYNISLDLGSTTTIGSGNYSFSLPPGWTSAASSVNRIGGSCLMRDNSGATHNFGGVYLGTSGTTVSVRLNAGNVLSNAAPWTWATSDFIYLLGTVELV